jgi:adenylylsulfate kinase-like enzyme
MFGKIIWIYGMSGAGKTTLGNRLAKELGFLIVDGDIARQILGAPRDFSPEARREHQNKLRGRLNQMSLMEGHNMVVASITPYESMRKLNRAVFKENYYEVLLDCSLDCLIRRDPKGLYAKACHGEIPYFTGITDAFEIGSPDLIVDTNGIGEEESYSRLLGGVKEWLQC